MAQRLRRLAHRRCGWGRWIKELWVVGFVVAPDSPHRGRGLALRVEPDVCGVTVCSGKRGFAKARYLVGARAARRSMKGATAHGLEFSDTRLVQALVPRRVA